MIESYYLLTAGLLCIVLSITHSILGEIMIFKKLHSKSFVLTQSVPLLKNRHLKIIWATWHLASLLATAIGSILIIRSTLKPDCTGDYMTQIIGITTFLCAGLVLWATRGKHPGWIVLLMISILLYLS